MIGNNCKSNRLKRFLCGIAGAFILACSGIAPGQARVDAGLIRTMGDGEKTVYLTFDDGPDPVNTISVMNTLMSHGANGTFFFTGVNMANNPSVVKLVYENGFGIGLHGYAHGSFAKMSADGIKKDVDATNNVLEGITGERSAIVRPPYGAVSATSTKTFDSIGIAQYFWTIDPRDWSSSQTDAGAIKNIKDNLKPGAIILLHSASGQSRGARILPEIITYIKSQGYEMKALPDAGLKSVGARRSNARFTINGEQKEFGAYVVDGVSYVGARELAAALSGTSGQFDVKWNNESRTVEIITGIPFYEASQTTTAPAGAERARAKLSQLNVLTDGAAAPIRVYSINGMSFYNLRELAATVGAGLDFDASSNTVVITPAPPVYSPAADYASHIETAGTPVFPPAYMK